MARDPYKYFRIEARELADQLGQGTLELERSGSGGEIVPRLLRFAHTLKGAARVVRQVEIADHAHAIEDVLSPFRETTGKVAGDAVEALLKRVDMISTCIGALDAPKTEPAPAGPAAEPSEKPSGSEAYRSLTTDVDLLDNLLEDVTEAYVQIAGLREAANLAGQARRLAETLGEQIAAGAERQGEAPAAPRVAASISQLRHLLSQVERRIVTSEERADRELRQAREEAEQLRLIPASALFAGFARTARDAAQALGKEVIFESAGGDIRLDAPVMRMVQDAVIQLIRNAVAHGIEKREERLAAGKRSEGRVSLTVARRARRVVFTCKDDGKGIDVETLRRTAIRQGLVAADVERLDAPQLVRLLLGSGISTSTAVTEVSGRGIGMDVVRQAAANLKADFTVTTEPGRGTTFELIVPLSVSSVDTLIVEAGGIVVTLPMHAVRHALRLDRRDIHRTTYGDTIVYEGHATPLVPLSRLLGGATRVQQSGPVSAIIIGGAKGHAAIVADRVLRTSSTVFRTLPELAPATGIVAGASFDADGSPLLMLDPDGLIDAAFRESEPAEAALDTRPLLVIDDSLTTRMLEQSILESAGYSVDLATSAEEGLEIARRGDYALFLVDVEMPGMDGFTFIEHIRRDQKLRNIPAILVTSRNAPEDLSRGMDVGAQGYVVKSEFDQAELLARIKQLVA